MTSCSIKTKSSMIVRGDLLDSSSSFIVFELFEILFSLFRELIDLLVDVVIDHLHSDINHDETDDVEEEEDLESKILKQNSEHSENFN